MIAVGYMKTTQKCPLPRVEYRFVPRTFLDEQLQGNTTAAISGIFRDADPFLGRLDLNAETVTNEENNYGSNFYTF